MRHWSLIRMLYCPLRFPFSFSSLFPGGIRRSSSASAASRIRSLRCAERKICLGSFRGIWPLNSLSVSESAKDLINNKHNSATRYWCQVLIPDWCLYKRFAPVYMEGNLIGAVAGPKSSKMSPLVLHFPVRSGLQSGIVISDPGKCYTFVMLNEVKHLSTNKRDSPLYSEWHTITD